MILNNVSIKKDTFIVSKKIKKNFPLASSVIDNRDTVLFIPAKTMVVVRWHR